MCLLLLKSANLSHLAIIMSVLFLGCLNTKFKKCPLLLDSKIDNFRGYGAKFTSVCFIFIKWYL